MPKNNNIDFNLNVKKGDFSGLESLKKDLAQVRTQVSNPDWAKSLDLVDLKRVLSTVNEIDRALDKAFDINLNTVNIQKFNQLLTQSGLNAKTIQQNLTLAGSIGNQAFLKLTTQLMQFNTATKQTNQFLNNIATSFFNTVKYTAFNAMLNNIASTVSRANNYVKDLDTSLNDIRIVTGKSADEMERFAESANNAAKELAVTTKEYTKGSLIYYQQGLNDETVKTLTDITAMTSNVTGQSMEVVSEQLTAVWNGYQAANEAAREGMSVYQEYVDKMAAVGATTASDLQELSSAMSKVASAASAMGVTFDDLNAQIATIVSVTRQAPESVGTALKTIYARLGDLKVDGVDEFGTKLGEVSEQLQTMGIRILDTNGDMRDMSSVMTEVAEKWDTWTSAQKQAAAVAMAGKRQYNNLVALFDNWDMYGDALATSMNAAGTLEKQQEVALDSLANKMDQLAATAEDLYDSLIDENNIKKLIESLTKIVQLLADFADAVGGINNIIPMVGATAMRVFNQQIAEGLSTIIINTRTARAEAEIMQQNYAALHSMFKDSILFTPVQGDDRTAVAQKQSLQELMNYYQQIQQYQGLMTEEQKVQHQNILDMKREAGELNMQLATQKDLWLATWKTLQSINNSDIIHLEKNVHKVADGIREIRDAANGLETLASKYDPKDIIDTKDAFAELLNDNNIAGTNPNLFSGIVDKFESLNGYSTSFKEVITQIVAELRKMGDGASELINLQTKMDNLNGSAQSLAQNLEQGLSVKQITANIVNLVGAVGQLSIGLNTLKHIFDIIEDDSLDISDKLLQVMMNLSFVIPSLVSSLKSVSELKIFGDAIKLVANDTEVLTNAINATTDAIKANNLVEQENILLQQREAQQYAIKNSQLKAEQAHNQAIKRRISWEKERLIQQRETAVQEAATLEMMKIENAYEEIRNAKLEAENQIRTANAKIRQIEILQGKAGTAEKWKEIAAIKAHKKATETDSAAMLVNIALKKTAVAVALGVVAAIVLTVKWQQKQLEKQIEANKLKVEEIEKTQEQVKTNQELVKSYKELYEQYQKGEDVQTELYDKILEVAQAYNIQGAAVMALAGYYEELNQQIKDKQIQEAKDAAQSARESAELNARNAIQGASKGTKKGNLHSNDTVSYAADFSYLYLDYTGQEKDRNLRLLVDNYLKEIGLGPTWTVDFKNPEEVVKFAEAVDKAEKFFGEVGIKEAQEYFADIKKELNENGIEEVQKQLDLSYKYIAQARLGEGLELDKVQTATDLFAQIKDVRTDIIKEGLIPEDKIDDYIQSYLEGIDEIQVHVNRIDIAEQLKKQKELSDEEFEELLEQLDKYNEAELAYINIHINSDLLDEELGNWVQERQPIISLLKTKGNAAKFKTMLASYDEKKGFTSANIASLYEQGVGGAASSEFLPSKEIFLMSDAGKQYSAVADAMIESTKKVVQEKDELILKLQGEQEYYQRIRDTNQSTYAETENTIKAQIEGNDQLKDKLSEVENIAMKLAKGTKDDLEPAEYALLSTITAQGVATEEQIIEWGKVLNITYDAQSVINSLSSEIKNLEQQELEHAKILELLNTKMSVHNAVMDDIQTAYSTLEGAVDDYNEKGFWTVDNIQKIIALDDKYIATLELENGQVQIGEEAFQKLSIAKLEDIRATVMETAYEKLETIALKDTGEAALLAAEAVMQAAIATGELTDTATNSLPALAALSTKLSEISGKFGADSLEAQAAENIIKSATNVSLMIDNAIAGIRKGGSSMASVLHTGKKSGSSKDKDKDKKEYRDEFDRYFEIKKAIDAVDRAIKKLDKDQENLFGKELIRSLKQENELLKDQTQLYEQLVAAQREEAEELQGLLKGYGLTFDASGAITNYVEATTAALKQYNDAVTSYNAGLLDESAFKVYEKNYEKFKKVLSRYDTLFYTEMKDTQEKLDELWRKELANNLKAWEVEIQLKLDWQQLERDWNDFLTEISKDFKSVFKDLRVELRSMLTDAGTYTGSSGTINSIIGAVHDVTGEIDKLMGGGSSSMFESVSQAQEKLKELNTQLMDSSKELHDLWENAWDNYLDGIDQVSDAFDKLLARFERINDELEFQSKLIELLYGDEAYGLMSKLYEGQEQNAEVQLQSLKTQVDMWKQLFDASGATMENQMQWSEDQQKYYDNWVEAQTALNDLVLEYIELLKKDYINTVSDVLKQLESFVTGGSSLSYMATQWERISDNAAKYYDDVEGAYYIQTLANKINEGIANSSSLKAQQKLIALREKEINYLREKETLTEYDIKAAELRYQIALKEIALEEAQQNKTGMKLTRNEQGNWSYQYVADEEDVANKRQDLLDAYNDLYQLASDAYEANLQALQDLQQKYIDSAREIYENENLTEEERQQQLLELREWYLEQYRLLSEENQLYRNDLATAGSALLLEVYKQDEEAYQSMTENERELLDALVNANIDSYMDLEEKIKDNYQNIDDKAREVMSEIRADWTSGAQTIAELWNKDSGWSVKTQVIAAYDAIQLANQKYKEAVDWCAAAVERNFGPEGIVGAIQNAEYETDLLRDKTVEMVNTAVPYLQELKSYVNQIESAWEGVQQAIRNAISLIEEYLRKVGEASVANAAQGLSGAAVSPDMTGSGSSGSGGGSNLSGSGNQRYNLYGNGNYGVWTDPGTGQVINGPNTSRDASVSGMGSGIYTVTASDGLGGSYTAYADTHHLEQVVNHYKNLGYKVTATRMASGGYTGEWGDTSGKLAFLHQKELVLNEDDTANFLSAINTVRDLNSGLNHSIQDAVLNAVARTALSVGGLNTGVLGRLTNNNSNTDNVFNITAEFPNANNVDEIREAILSLPNIASQYINSNLK